MRYTVFMKMDTKTIASISDEVRNLLAVDKSGHGMEHVDRVLQLALLFAKSEGADTAIVTLAVLLHDVDDYKLFGQESADGLLNATRILRQHNVDSETSSAVLDIIKTMGYNRYLEGVRPSSLEGKVVSDADMCDAIGAIGILRTHAYALSKGNEFFDKTIAPIHETMSAEEYRAQQKTHSAQHFFDKLFKIPAILMTESGKKEGAKREAIMVHFLDELFNEENAPEWSKYLQNSPYAQS